MVLKSCPLFRGMKMPVFASTLLAVTGVFSFMYTRPASLADDWLQVIRQGLRAMRFDRKNKPS
jgi:hypothetical protein